MALLITLFLVLVNIFNNVTTNSPKAETLTAIEIWMLACILFVFGKYKYNPSIKNFIKILWISYIYCQSVERDHFIFHYYPANFNVPLMTYSTFRHLTCHQRMSSREHSYIHIFIYSCNFVFRFSDSICSNLEPEADKQEQKEGGKKF